MDWKWFDGQPKERGRFQHTNIGADADARMFLVGKCFRVTQGYPDDARVVASRYSECGGAIGILVESDTFEECDVSEAPAMPVPTCVLWEPTPEEIAAQTSRPAMVDADRPTHVEAHHRAENKHAAPEAG